MQGYSESPTRIVMAPARALGETGGMKRRREIQELIPETHRDLVKAVPKGFARSGIHSGILLGAVAGSLLTYLVPAWLAAPLLCGLFVAHFLYIRRSDALFDERMAELHARNLEWSGEED